MPLTRISAILEKAQRRLNGLRYIDPNLNLGNGLSVKEIASLTEALDAKLKAHNAMVDALAKSRAEIAVLEDTLNRISERILNTIAAIYGKESDEYEIVGGKKRVRQTSSPNANDGGAPSPNPMAMMPLSLNATENGAKSDGQNGKSN